MIFGWELVQEVVEEWLVKWLRRTNLWLDPRLLVGVAVLIWNLVCLGCFFLCFDFSCSVCYLCMICTCVFQMVILDS